MFELEIFRAGQQKASDGSVRTFTHSDLDEVVQSYDPSKFKAPLIVSMQGGHDTGGVGDAELVYSELAFGYPQKLKRIGDRLIAQFEKIAPEFKRWVKEGRILDRSASFYRPEASSNPHPGKLSLRHIAALGRTPPAVKGMSDMGAIALSEFSLGAEDGVIEFSLHQDLNVLVSQALRGVRGYLVTLMGIDEADLILPDSLLSAIERCGSDRLTAMPQSFSQSKEGPMKNWSKDQIKKALNCSDSEAESFARSQAMSKEQLAKLKAMYPDEDEDEVEAVNAAEFAELRSAVEALKIENQVLKLEAQQRSQEAERAKIQSFVEAQIGDRKVLPADRQATIDRLMAMPTTVLSFGEAETTPRQMLMNEISSRKPLYGEAIDLGDSPMGTQDFAEIGLTVPDGYSIDPEGLKLYQKAKAYQLKNNVEFTEALEAVGGGR